MSYSPNSKPNKSNNQEQEEKLVGKGKQKATSSTSKNNKVKNSMICAMINTENNKQTDTEHVHIIHNIIDTQDNIINSTTSDDINNKLANNKSIHCQIYSQT
ncbi:17124_t:CDS:2 [Cetraspora pellucida]|uniref:17124_t:CDS:1 n=1 Tax=Cetraspora pellucida TaxID=1433469 RepID=A0A9N9FK41_9GLOM|nr:17124_t:CDS:2 [Cetraspora pellucida]